MRSVPPNGKLPELVCEFFWSGRQRPRRRPGPGAGPAPDLRFSLRARLLSVLRSGGPGGGVFSEIFAFSAPQKWWFSL